MEKKVAAGIVLFGSVWGMLECLLGDALRNHDLPAGAIMSGVVALGLMSYSRMVYKRRGMQLGMAGVASILRLMNPFTGCLICSAIAILVEGAIFEILWYNLFDMRELRKIDVVSLGIVTSYLCYVGGFITTQILTPIAVSIGFNLDDLIAFLPQILARGFPACILGAFSLPLVNFVRSYDISRIRSTLYYPIVASVSLICWIVTIVNGMP